MAGPRYNNFTIRDELNLLDTGHVKGAASVSGTAGKLTTFKATTLSGNTTYLGATTAASLTSSGDFTRNSVKYMSGASTWTLPTGFTRCIDGTTLIDEGVAILSGISGNLTPKLSTSPTVGKLLTLVFINSGASSKFTAKVSGNFVLSSYGSDQLAIQYFATFNKRGDAVTLTGDGTYWYPTTPHASGEASPGPVWSTT